MGQCLDRDQSRDPNTTNGADDKVIVSDIDFGSDVVDTDEVISQYPLEQRFLFEFFSLFMSMKMGHDALSYVVHVLHLKNKWPYASHGGDIYAITNSLIGCRLIERLDDSIYQIRQFFTEGMMKSVDMKTMASFAWAINESTKEIILPSVVRAIKESMRQEVQDPERMTRAACLSAINNWIKVDEMIVSRVHRWSISSPIRMSEYLLTLMHRKISNQMLSGVIPLQSCYFCFRIGRLLELSTCSSEYKTHFASFTRN